MMTSGVEWVERNGTSARGKREYIGFLRGQHLTMKQRVLANCYECTGMYTDGREDCETETCAFHVYMPYRKNGAVKRENPVRRNESKTEGNPAPKRRKHQNCCRGMSSGAFFRP